MKFFDLVRSGTRHGGPLLRVPVVVEADYVMLT